MSSRTYVYGGADLRAQVKAILARPAPPAGGRARALALFYQAQPARFPWPHTEYVSDEFGPKPKGTRADAILLDELRRATSTGRASAEEVRQILGAMFGATHAGAWDDDFAQLVALIGA